jgi:hypothetical protein
MGAFGVDTLDPAVSTRRVWVLLQRLPPGWLRNGEPWSTEAELLALLIDHVAALTWVTMRAHGAKRAQRPRPIPRPGSRHRPAPEARAEAGEVKHASWADAAAALAGMTGMRSRGG